MSIKLQLFRYNSSHCMIKMTSFAIQKNGKTIEKCYLKLELICTEVGDNFIEFDNANYIIKQHSMATISFDT